MNKEFWIEISHPSPKNKDAATDGALGQRTPVIWEFKCDLSYDGSPDGNERGHAHDPITYVFAGFLSRPENWNVIEAQWREINRRYEVPRFHAAHLNGRTHEYAGWDAARGKAYSSELLEAINNQGVNLLAFSCGIFVDQYRRIISKEGQRKLGSPYLACFNSCIASVAWMMDQCRFPVEDKFAVLIDRDNGYSGVIESFRRMQRDQRFSHHSRLADCTPADMEDSIPLQSGDLIAYELFKWAHSRGRGHGKIRPILPQVIKRHVVVERYWDSTNLGIFKDRIESEQTEDGQLVIVLNT